MISNSVRAQPEFVSEFIVGKYLLVGEALNIMNNKKITSLFICEKNKPIGIIHVHDLLRLSS